MVGLPPFRNNYRLIKVCLRDRTVYKDRIKEYSFVGSYYVSFSYYNYILHSFRSLGDIYVFLFLNIVSFFFTNASFVVFSLLLLLTGCQLRQRSQYHQQHYHKSQLNKK